MTGFEVTRQEKTSIKNNKILNLIQKTPLTITQIKIALHDEYENYADTIKRLVTSNHVAEAGYGYGENNKRAMAYIALAAKFTAPEEDDDRNKVLGARLVKLTENKRWTPRVHKSDYGVSGATLSGNF